MLTYLSCSIGNTFFEEAVRIAHSNVQKENGISIRLCYPPKAGFDGTGFVPEEVQQILAADIVIFDVTPTRLEDGQLKFSPGVMLELGMTLVRSKISPSAFVKGVFLDDSFRKSDVSPIIQELNIKVYHRSESKKDDLVKDIIELIYVGLQRVLDRKIEFTNFIVNGYRFHLLVMKD